MRKQFTFSEDEYNKLLTEKDNFRKQNQELLKTINKLEEEISFIKTTGDDILVVIKDVNKNDEYHFKTKDKDVIKTLIEHNREIIEKNENFIYKINELLNKVNSLEDTIEMLSEELKDRNDTIEEFKKRSFINRLLNKEPK